MHSTSTSLLQQLRQGSRTPAWERFVRLYTPLLFYWARRLGLQEQDAADLVQDVLVVLVRKLPEFQYEPGRSFRGWMRTILLNKWRDRPHPKPALPLDSDVQPLAPADADALEEREYRLYLVGRALRLMTADFEPTTWRACWETVIRTGAAVVFSGWSKVAARFACSSANPPANAARQQGVPMSFGPKRAASLALVFLPLTGMWSVDPALADGPHHASPAPTTRPVPTRRGGPEADPDRSESRTAPGGSHSPSGESHPAPGTSRPPAARGS
jgi:RNA polymerase sigma-70 factor (ECF subfamily)